MDLGEVGCGDVDKIQDKIWAIKAKTRIDRNSKSRTK
jgi:hypothetical protein